MNLTYINTIAPTHDRTSCSDAHAINGRFSADDMGGCYRCTLMATTRDKVDTLAPEHERTSCSDAHAINGRFSADDMCGCYRCTLLDAQQA